MPRYIDADALIAKWEEEAKHIEAFDLRGMVYAAINDVKRQPTVDAVEVVRCRDCEFRYEGEYRGRRVMMCDYMDPEPEDKMSDDDFCSRGRKNDAEKADKQN